MGGHWWVGASVMMTAVAPVIMAVTALMDAVLDCDTAATVSALALWACMGMYSIERTISSG
jgi:hypothetical protein